MIEVSLRIADIPAQGELAFSLLRAAAAIRRSYVRRHYRRNKQPAAMAPYERFGLRRIAPFERT